MSKTARSLLGSVLVTAANLTAILDRVSILSILACGVGTVLALSVVLESRRDAAATTGHPATRPTPRPNRK